MARDRYRERDDDTPDVYYIPPNYKQFGGLGGIFKLRNTVEAVIIAGPIAWLTFQLTGSIAIENRVVVILFAAGIPALFALFDIMNLSFG